MSVFVWPTPFWAVVRRNRRGIDKDYGPRGHSGCARRKWPCRGSWRRNIYTYAMACAGREPHTEASEGAACVVSTRGGSELRGVVSVGLGSAPFDRAFPPWTRPSWPRPFFPPSHTTVDVMLLICEPQHCLFKWGLEKKWEVQAKRAERIERGV